MAYTYKLDSTGCPAYECTCSDCGTAWESDPKIEDELCPECESDRYTVTPVVLKPICDECGGEHDDYTWSVMDKGWPCPAGGN